jgi:hypothetical protein
LSLRGVGFCLWGALMSILSRLCIEVKEICSKSVAFRDAPAHRIYVAFRDNAHNGTGEMLYIQHSSF